MRMSGGGSAQGMTSLERKTESLCDCERDDRSPTITTSLSAMQRLFIEIRRVVREELRAHQDRQSFAAAAGLVTIDEAATYLRISRSELSRLRHARKIAKADTEKDAAFAPEYGSGKNIKFRRTELDAWLVSQRR